MSRTAPHQQPKVPTTYRWLATHLHEGLALDLFGCFDEDGYEVNDIALVGTNVSLAEIVEISFLERMTDWCNNHLPTAAELRRKSANDSRFERELWNRRQI